MITPGVLFSLQPGKFNKLLYFRIFAGTEKAIDKDRIFQKAAGAAGQICRVPAVNPQQGNILESIEQQLRGQLTNPVGVVRDKQGMRRCQRIFQLWQFLFSNQVAFNCFNFTHSPVLIETRRLCGALLIENVSALRDSRIR